MKNRIREKPVTCFQVGKPTGQPPGMNRRLGSQVLGDDPRSLAGGRMHDAIKVLHGRKSMVCANKVVPTYMRLSGSANIIEIGDPVQFHEHPAVRGFTEHRDILNLTLVKRTIL